MPDDLLRDRAAQTVLTTTADEVWRHISRRRGDVIRRQTIWVDDTPVLARACNRAGVAAALVAADVIRTPGLPMCLTHSGPECCR
jgi:hypothetical protein